MLRPRPAVAIQAKARGKVTPHVLRRTNSMQLLQSGVDTVTIALWLGHESVRTTDIYLHADMSLKREGSGAAGASLCQARSLPGRRTP